MRRGEKCDSDKEVISGDLRTREGLVCRRGSDSRWWRRTYDAEFDSSRRITVASGRSLSTLDADSARVRRSAARRRVFVAGVDSDGWPHIIRIRTARTAGNDYCVPLQIEVQLRRRLPRKSKLRSTEARKSGKESRR